MKRLKIPLSYGHLPLKRENNGEISHRKRSPHLLQRGTKIVIIQYPPVLWTSSLTVGGLLFMGKQDESSRRPYIVFNDRFL